MELLDGSHAAHLGSNLCEALFLGLLCHAVVHVGPLVVFALGGSLQIASGILYGATFKVLEPHLGVLFLIGSCLFKDGSYLLEAVLLGA